MAYDLTDNAIALIVIISAALCCFIVYGIYYTFQRSRRGHIWYDNNITSKQFNGPVANGYIPNLTNPPRLGDYLD